MTDTTVRRLAGGPAEVASPEQVEMEVKNRLARAAAVIHNDPESSSQLAL
jgi:hypothetical protein